MKKNILALDLGKASCGIAISRSGMFVTPIINLEYKMWHIEEVIAYIKKLKEREKVEMIVIGRPVLPSGDKSDMTFYVEHFVEKLNQEFPDLPVEYQDEQYSTLEARAILEANGTKSRQKQDKIVDRTAALVILERYLRRIGQL